MSRLLKLVVACCALGMATKEVMVTAPVIVLWYDRVFAARSWRELFGEKALALKHGKLALAVEDNRVIAIDRGQN